jgi:hypothetical protein
MPPFKASLSNLKPFDKFVQMRPFSHVPFPLIRIRGLLQAEHQFAVALPEAERMFALNRRFASVVPPAVARACQIAMLQGEVAIIFCANGAAASRVRAQSKGIASVLTRADAPVNSIKVKIRADWSVPPPPEKHDIPVAGINAFKALQANLPDGELKSALERLLSRRGR